MAKQPEIVAELRITLDEHGQVEASGPVKNPMLCFGMLEMGKEAIRNYQRELAEKQKANIEVVSPDEMPGIGPNGRR